MHLDPQSPFRCSKEEPNIAHQKSRMPKNQPAAKEQAQGRPAPIPPYIQQQRMRAERESIFHCCSARSRIAAIWGNQRVHAGPKQEVHRMVEHLHRFKAFGFPWPFRNSSSHACACSVSMNAPNRTLMRKERKPRSAGQACQPCTFMLFLHDIIMLLSNPQFRKRNDIDLNRADLGSQAGSNAIRPMAIGENPARHGRQNQREHRRNTRLGYGDQNR